MYNARGHSNLDTSVIMSGRQGGGMDTMKPMVQEGGELFSHAAFTARGLCELRLHGESYFLVEDTTTGFLSSDSGLDAVEVGYCQINDRTYTIFKPATMPASV